MAMPRKQPVAMGTPFPGGAWAVGGVQPVRDYDKSTRDSEVQQIDKETGLPLWQVEVIDGDEDDGKKSSRALYVKIPAKVQPVLPTEKIPGTPFRPVEFENLTVLPWIEQVGENFTRIAYSYSATGMRAPGKGGQQPKAAAS